MQARGETLMKKLFWSSLILHIAAIAVTAAAFALLWTGLQDVENLLYTYETFLAAFAVGAVIYAADIVLLILIQKDKLTDIRKINSLFASLFGDLCLALGVISVFSLKTNAATILSAVTEGIIAANAVVRTVFAVKLKRNIDAPRVCEPPLSAGGRQLTLVSACMGLIAVLLGVALFCVLFLYSYPFMFSPREQEATSGRMDGDPFGELFAVLMFFGGVPALLLMLCMSFAFFSLLNKPGRGTVQFSFSAAVTALNISVIVILFTAFTLFLNPTHLLLHIAAALYAASSVAACVLGIICAARIRHMQNVPPSETPLSQ